MIRTWRDTPKPGETDAKWCALYSENGHIVQITKCHETEEDALMVMEFIRITNILDQLDKGKK